MNLSSRLGRTLLGSCVLLAIGGCATIRVTDPTHTADELYLQNVATQLAVSKLSTAVLRDRKVYIESAYLTTENEPTDQYRYLLGELRAKLLLGGVRLMPTADQAEIILEVRSQGVSNDHIEFLLGLSSQNISGGLIAGGTSVSTPELDIIKRTTQLGFSSVAYVAYWADTGEVVASSGPFVGRTKREDYWFFGYGPRTFGNIPPAEPEPSQTEATTAPVTKTNSK